MSKRKTPLKALEKLDHTICLNRIDWGIDKYDHCDCKNVEEFVECYDIAEKALRALKIIKEKKVEVNILEFCETCEEYNDFIKHRVWFQEEYILTQEEYELVKEVIKWKH